jgi:hypothetical protein
LGGAAWSQHGGQDCLRLAGVPPGILTAVRPRTVGIVGELPATAGRFTVDGDDLCFVPRYPFVAGTTYVVTLDRVEVAALLRPLPDGPATTEVVDIRPTADEVPRNLLRLYVLFSAPMREGCAATQVRLADAAGTTVNGALLAAEDELWDTGRRRLTVLLDPARIKRGLVPHAQVGYPLRMGESFRLVIDEGFTDAGGRPLRAGAERSYHVAADERRHVDPAGWALAVPAAGTVDPLIGAFDRPLDHGLLLRCLKVLGPAGGHLAGQAEIGPGERSWLFTPAAPWTVAPHRLVVDPLLEDLAGNSVSRVFDRDLRLPENDPRDERPVVIEFIPRVA